MKLVLLAASVSSVLGHGAMVIPASRNAIETYKNASTYPAGDGACPCANGAKEINGTSGVGLERECANANACYWFSQGCTIGCPSCDGTPTRYQDLCGNGFNFTLSNPQARTFNRDAEPGSDADNTKHHPWRAPGSAPVLDVCGVAGGTHNHPYNTDGAMYPGDWSQGASHMGPKTEWAKFGDLGSKLPTGPTTIWKAGSSNEVAWTIEFNHGGGYHYSLCPTSEPLTEECFNKYPLDFNKTGAELRFMNKTVVSIQGTYVDEGTVPVGSTWAMNPIPARQRGEPALPIQFDPPCNEGGVPGTCSGDSARYPSHLGLQIVDHVIVPESMAPGSYVLRWRWDCEGSAQVWTNCADIEVATE